MIISYILLFSDSFFAWFIPLTASVPYFEDTDMLMMLM